MDWYYGARWGLTDLYPEVETELRGLIESGDVFDVVSIPCEKEFCGWSISRDGKSFHISVWAFMDDVPEIIYDAEALCDCELTEEEFNKVLELLQQHILFTGFSTEESVDFIMPNTSTLDQIYEKVEEAGDELNRTLENHFDSVSCFVNYVLGERRYKND